jgi:nicotinamidase-related amidase
MISAHLEAGSTGSEPISARARANQATEAYPSSAAQPGVRIIWLNWGNRLDRKNLPPTSLYVFSRDRNGIGIGGELPGNGAHLLEKDSWLTAVVDELEQLPEDIKVDKCRISGFWDTPLDSILKNLGVKTLFFSGVNTDQCVLHSLTDAHFLG